MRKVLISRFGAYGDHIHATHLPRLLKQKCGFDHIAFQYNVKGFAIYQNNPFIDEHIFYDPSAPPVSGYPINLVKKRMQYISEAGKFDRVIDLQNSIEYGYIAMEDQAEYYLSSEYRREKYGKLNYYDQTSLFVGHPEWFGEKGEIYFDDEEETTVKSIYERMYKNKFVVIANLSGSSKHKLLYNAENIIYEFLEKHKDAMCILTGDESAGKNLKFSHERVINRAGNFDGDKYYPFRQSMLMTKYADLVIGAESGLMVASTLFGTPTVQLMTAASIKNHGGDFANDYSLQSPAPCSPCHKGPYDYIGCPKFEHLGIKYPICVKFDKNTILSRMDEVYDHRRQEISA